MRRFALRRRVDRTLRFEALEERQLLHGGPAQVHVAEVLPLAIGKAQHPSKPVATQPLSKVVQAERLAITAKIAVVRSELWQLWRELDAHKIDGAHFRPERAALRAERDMLHREWAMAGAPKGEPSTPAKPIIGVGKPHGPRSGSTGQTPTLGVVPFTAGTVVIQATTPFTTEGGSNAVFTLTASPAPTSTLYVTFTIDATSTAIRNTDYTLSVSGMTAVIPAGTSTATIYVTPLDDASSGETLASERLTLDLSSLSGGSGSGSGGGSYTIGSPSSATVIIRDPDIGTTPVVGSPGGGSGFPGLFPGTSDSNGGEPALGAVSESGIRYGNGQVDNAVGQFLASAGFGQLFGQTLQWTNIPGLSNGSVFGLGMVNSVMPSIQQTSTSGIMVVQSATSSLWFDFNSVSGTYTAKFFESSQYNLQADGSSGDFVMTDPQGDQVRFYGFETSIPVAQRGTFKSFTDPYGNVIGVTSHTGSGQIGEIQRSATVSGTTTLESYLFTYLTTGVNSGLVQNVTLRRQVNSGGWTTVRQAVYAYYDGTQSFGNPGDLQTETIEDASGSVLDTTAFRYYLPADSNGYVDGLKYVFGPDAYARALGAGVNPLTASDGTVAPYANKYYQYDSQQRVALETLQGAGPATTGTYTYTYSTSNNAAGYNSWLAKTVETLPDGNTNTAYTNFAGELMLRDFYDGTDAVNTALQGKHWITLTRYDSLGRLSQKIEPAAITGYSDSFADLMNYTSGTSTYLSNSSGAFHLYDYGTTTTATSTTAGDVAGYLKDAKIQVGQSGTPITLSAQDYIAHTAGTITVYPEADATVYRNMNTTGAETTSNTYTWVSGTNGLQSVATTAPVISSAQNGPGTADVTTVFYDNFG